jgi:hypothetical protein
MIYLKHYWMRNGEYLTEPGQNGSLQYHPGAGIDGFSVRYWLTDERGVDYCLSTANDNALIQEHDPGMQILTKTEWDAIVATIPEPEFPIFPPAPQEPNWDAFETVVLQSEEMKNFVSVASTQNVLVSSAFPAAFYEAKNGNYSSFQIVWDEIVKISPVDPLVVSSMVGIASSCNLPTEFISIISG